MPRSSFPSVTERFTQASARGYFVAHTLAGLPRWLNTCLIAGRPAVWVRRDGRRGWIMRAEMPGGWRFTDHGQQLLNHLLAEHAADMVLISTDFVSARNLTQPIAELIAATIVRWFAAALAQQQAEGVQ